MSQLTGKRRYRIGGLLRTKLILQVEIKTSEFDHQFGSYTLPSHHWRDARVEDLMIIQAVHRPFPIAENT